MGRIHVVPKSVMDTIDTHLHHHKIVPILGGEEMSCELETLASHLVYIGENLWLVARTKVPDVEDVFSNYLLDFLLQFVSGVRKSPTSAPLSGRGGYVPGTPIIIERLPLRERMSHNRSSLMASE